ncbi:unnamed protein product [Sphagnum compactum]
MHCITVCGKFDIAKDARNCCKGDLKKLFHFRTEVGGGRRVQLVLKRSSSFPSLSGERTCDDGRSNGSRAHRRGAGAAAAPLLLLRAISESSSSHGDEGSPIRRGGDGEEQKEKKIAAAVPPPPTSSSAVLQEHYWALRILTEVALIWRSLQYSSIRFDYWLASLQTTNRGKYILRTSSSRERSASACSSSLLQTKAAAAAAREEEAHGVVIAEVRIRSSRQQRSGREQQERYLEFHELQGEDDSRYSSSSTHGRLQGALFKNLKRALPQLEERTQGFAVSQWLHRLSKTYGTRFMVLVVLGYCTQGFRCFPWLAMSYYFKDTLQVAPGTMQFLISTATLPMVAKPIYGIISDSIFIGGSHRVPYLVFAGALQLLSWGAIVVHPGVSSSIVALTFMLMLSNVGGAISEVMNDALVAEAGKRKKGAKQGELQSLAWLALASGGLVGNLMGGYALQRIGFKAMFCLFMMLVGAHLLVCVSVKEGSFGLRHPKIEKDDLPQQILTLGNLLQNPEIIRPLLWFLSSYAIIPSLGSSLFFYQTQHLGLDASVVGLARVVGQMGLMAGSIIYNKALKDVPLRKMFASAQILLALCMLSDILLVNRVNLWLGVPDKYFILGASAFVDAISQFKILPFLVLLARLCPPGNEGSLFSFFMSAHCLACTLSAYFGVGLASFLQISATSFTGLPLGIFIQAVFAVLPVIWINFIPEAETSTTDMFTKR